jgi:hypothetical protein
MLAVCQAWESGRFAALPRRWRDALYLYANPDGDSTLEIVVRMALAHILEDLPSVLRESQITKSEYDSILDDVVACGATAVLRIDAQGRFGDLLQSLVRSVARPLMKGTVWTLREIAWRRAFPDS